MYTSYSYQSADSARRSNRYYHNQSNKGGSRRNYRHHQHRNDVEECSESSDYSESSEASESSIISECSNSSAYSNRSEASYVHNYKKPALPDRSQYLALDCEMVGSVTGESMCARVVVVDFKGQPIYDAFVQPREMVADYRTFISGIRAEDLVGAEPLEVVQQAVSQLLKGKIVVGHGLENDLACLGINHPWHLIRDTAYYEPFMKKRDGTMAPRRLKDLAQEKLHRTIQDLSKPHSPTEDAITALDLYKRHRPRWEACIKRHLKQTRKQVRDHLKQQLRQREEQYYKEFFSQHRYPQTQAVQSLAAYNAFPPM